MYPIRLQDIATALALLTRLPIKAVFDHAARASWAYPLAGLVVAVVSGAITWLALILGMDAAIAAALYLITTLFVTGALHDDGLADTADGFWGGFDSQRRLEIMKDSMIGSYGVLALALSILTRWAAIWLLLAHGNWFWVLLAIECFSRAFMPLIMHVLPHARSTGLSHAQGTPPVESVGIAILIGFVCALIFTGSSAFLMALAGGALSVGLIWLAKQKIGGQTGDVLGANQQVLYIAMLALCV